MHVSAFKFYYRFVSAKRISPLWDSTFVSKSLYRSRAWSHFYGFGPGWQYWKKKLGPILSNFWGHFFYVFRGKKNIGFKKIYIVASALKSCIIYLLYIYFFKFFLNFFLAKNRLNIHNQLCIGLLETPLCATSI